MAEVGGEKRRRSEAMERVVEAGEGGNVEGASESGAGSGTGGRETAAMPDLVIRGIGDGRHADERDAVDRLPAGRARRAEADDTRP
jgi:hypothetical protein